MKYPRIFEMLIFGCIGITSEIFFVALVDNFTFFQEKGLFDPRMIGHSYIWMFFLYMWIPAIYHIIFPRLQFLALLSRLILYAFALIGVEFVAGFALDTIIGVCPWDYTGKTMFSILGYTRLDYFPFWMLFGFMCERICASFEKYKVV